MDSIHMRFIFLIFSLFFIYSPVFADSNKCAPSGGNENMLCPSNYTDYYDCTTTLNDLIVTSKWECNYVGTGIYPATGAKFKWIVNGYKIGSCPGSQRSNSSGKCIDPPYGYKPNIRYPNHNNNPCSSGTSKWGGSCIPDSAPPAPGARAGNTRYQVPEVNGAPDLSGAKFPMIGSEGGWRTYSGSDDYVPLNEGGGCAKFVGYEGWWCTFRSSYDANRDTEDGSLQPVPVMPGDSQNSSSGGQSPGPGSESVGGGSDAAGAGTGSGTGSGTGTGTGTNPTPTPGTDTGSGSGAGTGTGTAPDPGTGTDTGSNTGGGGSTGSGSGSGTTPTPTPGSGSSVTGGPCSVAFTCVGDPVMCATAREIHDYRCKFESINSLDSVPASDFDKNNPFGTDDFKKKSEDALNKSGYFDFDIAKIWNENRKAYITFSGSCQPSISIDLPGRTVFFDISILCKLGDFIRLILHIFAYMVVLRLIHRTLT